jgi:N-acetylneuraminic acid mutarotase
MRRILAALLAAGLTAVAAAAQAPIASAAQAQAASAAAAAPAAWSQLPPSPLKRLEVFGAKLGRSIYVMGGYEEQRVLGTMPYELSPVPSTKVERYDLDTGKWSFQAKMPMHLDHARAVAYRGKLYVTGGNNFIALAMPFFWEYDPAADKWTQLPMLPQPTAAHASAVIGDKLIVAGGYIFPLDFSTVQVFDFSTMTWSRGPDLPVVNDHSTGVALGGYMYVIGGRPNDLTQGVAYHEVFRWKPGMKAWQRVADLPYTRSGLGAAPVCGRIAVFGGEDPHDAPKGVVHAAELYDPRTDSWARLPDIPTPRHGLVGASDGNRVYAIEGGDVEVLGYTNAVERLTLDCSRLSKLKPAKPRPADPSCLPDDLPIVGGHCGAEPELPDPFLPLPEPPEQPELPLPETAHRHGS